MSYVFNSLPPLLPLSQFHSFICSFLLFFWHHFFFLPRFIWSFVIKNALSQHVNKPRRGDNILDLIFTTNDSLVSNVNTDPEIGVSDHKMVSKYIPRRLQRKCERRTYLHKLYRKGNFEKWREILADID